MLVLITCIIVSSFYGCLPICSGVAWTPVYVPYPLCRMLLILAMRSDYLSTTINSMHNTRIYTAKEMDGQITLTSHTIPWNVS